MSQPPAGDQLAATVRGDFVLPRFDCWKITLSACQLQTSNRNIVCELYSHHEYLPLNALRIFEAAARLESFSSAADELFVTHGAVSKQIKQLEEWLGVRLFERAGGRVKLTDTGWRYLIQVQDGLDLIANATSQLLQPDNQRRLTINSTPTMAMHWLMPRCMYSAKATRMWNCIW
jgi:hypothetical protein